MLTLALCTLRTVRNLKSSCCLRVGASALATRHWSPLHDLFFTAVPFPPSDPANLEQSCYQRVARCYQYRANLGSSRQQRDRASTLFSFLGHLCREAAKSLWSEFGAFMLSVRSRFGSLASFQPLHSDTGTPLFDHFPALRTERSWTLRVTMSLCVSFCNQAWELRCATRASQRTGFFPFHPTTAELASAGIECRAPASGPPRAGLPETMSRSSSPR